MEPPRKRSWLQNATHQVSLHHCRREKVFAARLPARRVIGITGKIVATAFLNQSREFAVTHRSRVIERKCQSKCGIWMNARSDGISLLGKKTHEILCERFRQRLQVSRPTPSIFIFPLVQLLSELQQPRPAVGALE